MTPHPTSSAAGHPDRQDTLIGVCPCPVRGGCRGHVRDMPGCVRYVRVAGACHSQHSQRASSSWSSGAMPVVDPFGKMHNAARKVSLRRQRLVKVMVWAAASSSGKDRSRATIVSSKRGSVLRALGIVVATLRAFAGAATAFVDQTLTLPVALGRGSLHILMVRVNRVTRLGGQRCRI
jgi:hypothetical protein